MNMLKDKFVPSINIKFDIGNDRFVDKYLPTPSHAEPLLGIANGLINNSTKAHIVVGPYGSGKSLLGTLLGNVSGKSVSEEALISLCGRFNAVNPDIEKVLNDLYKYRVKYIPVILEGNVGNFKNSLLSTIQRALDKNNVDIDVPGVTTDILHRIETWQREYPDTLIKLQKLVSKHWEWNIWLHQIENYDPNAISWFIEIYPQLTSGSPFQLSGYGGDITTQLEYVLFELNKRGLGLFVVHDEFGRFLQSLNTSQIHESMQDIQEVAELVNHSDYENMSIMLITHRSLRQYASRFNEDLQKEFQRIEKRFISYQVESDQATFIRLASYITTRYRKEWGGPEKEVTQGLSKFPLFPELTDFEVANLVAGGSYPLHPVSLFALPRLANVVAQNERTLFTILESDEPGGLKKHFKSQGNWYTIDNLFSYFEPSFEAHEVDSSIKDDYLLYKRSIRRLLPSEYNKDYLKIIKLLAIWEIANLKNKVTPSADFIGFALNWDETRTSKCLKDLAHQKIIRHLNDEDRWILYDGSHINVEKETQKRMYNFSITNREKMEFLDDMLSKRFFLPNEYNDEKSMTRFAVVHTVHAEEIQKNEEFFYELYLGSEADLTIFLVIVENIKELENVYQRAMLLSEKDESTFFVVPDAEYDELDYYIRQLKVLSELENDKNFMSQDKFLPDEISFLRREGLYSLESTLRGYLLFENRYRWIHSGQMIQISSEKVLSKYISKVAKDIYPSTPIVKNEAYNRRHISKVQRTNAIKLIDQLIDCILIGKSDIDISGFGPDYLIFATVLKNNSITLLQPELLSDNSLISLRNDLKAVLDQGHGSVKDLVSIFTNKPYGIRIPVIPVLFVSLLSTEWKHLMFYKNEMFVSLVDGELLWNIIHYPEDYTFNYQVPKEEDIQLAKLVKNTFGEFLQDNDQKLLLSLQVCKMLLQWYRSMPRFARSTNQQSVASNKFRELIKLSEVRPQEAIDEIYKLTENGNDELKLHALRKESENFLGKHEAALKQKILKKMNFNSYLQLREWADGYQGVIKHKSKFISSILTSAEENWVDVISETLVGVPRESWSDATNDVFDSEFENELKLISQDNYSDYYMELKSDEGLVLIPKIELSDKSKLIYENVKRTLQFTGRTVSKEEIRVVLWRLLKELSYQENKLNIDKLEV